MTSLLQESVKDPSRPFFQRLAGKLGIYIDVLEAEQNEQRHGSEHYYVMLLTETLCQEFRKLDLALLRGAFEKENICSGVVLDEFREGIVLVVSPDNMESLKGLREAYESEKLNQLLQRTLITDGMLRSLRATSITIRIRMWQDEYDSCMDELALSINDTTDSHIEESSTDMSMLLRAKECQTAIATDILDLRDGEDKFEQTLGEFINLLKRHSNSAVAATSSLKNLKTYSRTNKKTGAKANHNSDALDHYFKMVEKLRDIYGYVETELWFTLAQIHASCENIKQHEIKNNILQICRDTTGCLTDDNDLNKVSYPPWEGKILPREKEVVFGVISLIPMSISKLSDIDHMLDEYMNAGDIRVLHKKM